MPEGDQSHHHRRHHRHRHRHRLSSLKWHSGEFRRGPSGEYVGYVEIGKAVAVPVRKGDKLEDIEVIDISERDVVLQWMGQTIKLSIQHVTTIDKPDSLKGNTRKAIPKPAGMPQAAPVQPPVDVPVQDPGQ